MPNQIAEEIRSFIVRELLEEEDEGEFPEDQPLLGGFLDSFGLMVLINFVEDNYGLTVGNRDIVPGNFQSVEALARYVESKKR